MNNEQVAVQIIEGFLPVPEEVRAQVEAYRSYLTMRDECVAFPRVADQMADVIFDQIVLAVSK